MAANRFGLGAGITSLKMPAFQASTICPMSEQPPMLETYVFKHVCSHCSYETQDRSNYKRHLNSKCREFGARMIPYYAIAYTANIELAEAVARGEAVHIRPGLNMGSATDPAGATANTTHGNENHSEIHQHSHNITINFNFPAEVVASQSKEEAEAIVRHILEDKERFLETLASGDAASLVGHVFRLTKGADGPPQLRNMCVRGNDVVEKRGATTVSRTPLGKSLNTWVDLMMEHCKDILIGAPDELELTSQESEALWHVWGALFEPMAGESVSVKDVAEMLREDGDEFRKAVAKLKHAVRGSRECLAREFEKLRARRNRAASVSSRHQGVAAGV